MEGEGKSFRVLGFNQNQRAAFVQILMRLHSNCWFMTMSDLLVYEYVFKNRLWHANICSWSHFQSLLQVWGWWLWLEGICFPHETKDLWRNQRVLIWLFFPLICYHILDVLYHNLRVFIWIHTDIFVFLRTGTVFIHLFFF